jgi:hypothetical protein
MGRKRHAGQLVRHTKDFTDFIFAEDVVCRDQSSESQGSTGEDNVLHGRVDTGAAYSLLMGEMIGVAGVNGPRRVDCGGWRLDTAP